MNGEKGSIFVNEKEEKVVLRQRNTRDYSFSILLHELPAINTLHISVATDSQI